MKKKIAKLGIIAVLTFALILSSLGALPFGDTLAKEFDIGAKNQTTAQAAGAWDGSTKTAPTGEGTENSPYLIGTAEQLAYVADKVNTDATYSNGKFFKLTADIVLNAETPSDSVPGANAWTPIGTSANAFNGTFDGNGHTVSGIYINDTNESTGMYKGLFGHVRAAATIKNVGVINSYIKGNAYVGGVAGHNYGSIINCYNTGAVNGSESVGGVVGWSADGAVANSYNTGAVSGMVGVGGVVGTNDHVAITNCYNTGAVSGTTIVGGVVGWNTNGAVANCYFLTNQITIGGTLGAGNAVGTSAGTGTATNCSPFGANKQLTTAGDTPLTTDNKALVTFGANADLLATLNLGVTAYNGANPTATQATEWVAGAGVYPTFKPSEKPTPPTPDPKPAWTYPTSSTISTKPFAKGDGTVGAPFEISTPQELANMSYLINTANATYNGKDVHYKLMANIELNDTANWEKWGTTATGVKAWTPIGVEKDFNGKFDGNGKTVSGIYISGDVDYQGLFGSIRGTATVQNVGVIKSYIKGRNSVGGVVGYNFGAITNCYNLGSVNGTVDNIGGVVGQNNSGEITNCYNTGDVTGRNYVGGVVGYNPVGKVLNCYNNGDVTGTNYIGGVAGQHENGTVINCYNTGKVSGTTYVGGVVGTNRSSVVNCYNTGAVIGTESAVGGVVGYNGNASAVENCYNTGAVTVTTTKIGGVAGWNESGTVKNSYFLKITGTNSTNETLNAVGTGRSTACGYFTDNGETLTAEAGEIIGNYKKLLDALNAGTAAYNKTKPAPAILAMAWAADTEPGGYPKHTTDSVTPPDPEPDPTAWTYPTSSTISTKPFAVGDGTVGAPFEISTAQELANMSYLINTANTTYNGKDVFYKLTKDIVLNTGTITSASTGVKSWTPIGNNSSAFNGSFDGDGYTVSGLYINGEVDNQGLFGKTSATATVMNVGVKNSYIMGKFYPGGVVGWNSGAIFNCYNTGAVSGQYSVGGVVGMSMSTATVTNCYNTGVVTSTGNFSGGVLGSNLGSVTNCYNRKEVSGQNKVGGVVGGNSGSVDNCYNTGAVNGSSFVGGVAGSNESGGTVTNCYFLKITGSTNKDLIAVDTTTNTTTATCGTFVDNAGTLAPEVVGTIIDSKTNLLEALNAGATAYNKTEPGKANPAAEWVKGADNYPTLKMVKKPTPPTPPVGGGDSDSEPSISPEDIFWTRVITDLKLKDEPVVEFNCKYPRMSRRVLLALQEVDKTLNINLNGEKISLTSKQVKPLTFDKASYSVAELKALLEVKPEVTPTPTPTPTEKPTEPVVPEKPATNLTWLWILLAVIVVAGAVAAFLVIKRKKK